MLFATIYDEDGEVTQPKDYTFLYMGYPGMNGLAGIGDRVIAQVATGAFAEKLAAPQARCFRMPDKMDFVTGAGMVIAAR